MAVQKSKKTRSKRDSRRNENSKLKKSTISIDKETKESHIRHQMTKNGFYKGFKIIEKKQKEKNKEDKKTI